MKKLYKIIGGKMSKTAVLIYDSFCNFEISVALEILALNNREIVVFAKDTEVVTSEEGLKILPDKDIYDIDIGEFDSLLLPGAADIEAAVEDEEIIEFIKKFNGKIIGAISIAPILLVKAGMLNGKAFMAGVNKEDLLEEGFLEAELVKMKDWNECIENSIEDGYILEDKIITSVSYNFIKFGLQFAKMLGIEISPKSFGI
ncbi:DJ-1/PfpI family protein [Peptoniphilus duerdenii ATCC BAA-1640]|uniref:DJ-1/PfpI family protein n=2 Tax=Peptoniphilus TaxID=162289 RepID=E0NLR6_9FIRM|nr:DJ-1/PfpI family protein [Peptoniphilus duerdenii ATCC BAA-1640]